MRRHRPDVHSRRSESGGWGASGDGFGPLLESVVVAAPPLGVLSAFPSFVSDGLMGQHQHDQGQLLRALSAVAQTWQQKTHAVAQLVATLDGEVSDPVNLGDRKREGNSSRKAKLEQAAAALYGSGGSGKEEAFPHSNSSPIDQSACASSSVENGSFPSSPLPGLHDAVYTRKTGLASLAQVQHAAHGVLSALIKMRSVLQECVLALRVDLLNTSCDGRRPASSLRELLQREADAADTSNNSHCERSTSHVSALALWKGCEPLSLLDALAALRTAVMDIWVWKCERRFLNEDSLILLAG